MQTAHSIDHLAESGGGFRIRFKMLLVDNHEVTDNLSFPV